MNHSIRIDVGEANARLALYKEMFPEISIPATPQVDRSQSPASTLNNLALFALHHNATLPALYAYKRVFLDLMSRWVENPDKFEQAYCEFHRISPNHIGGSIVLMALSRVIAVYPESCNLIDSYLRTSQTLSNIETAVSAPADPSHLHRSLLALYRIYTTKPHKFKHHVSVVTLQKVLELGSGYDVAKYLAIALLAAYLNASETSKDEMANAHLQSDKLVGVFDADYSIDYKFLALVEAKRLSNYTKLPLNVVGDEKNILTITPDDLSPLVISICGILVSNASGRQNASDHAVETENSVHVLRSLAQNIQNDRPVMLYGSAGSGKTFLINQLARFLSFQDDIVKIHLGEQTDAKLLLGTYTSGEKPGSFQWRSGVLTTAVKEGKWVLVEDIDKAPTEVLSILLTLLEKRELSIPSRGEVIRAHSGFQLISTIRTSSEISSKVPDMIGLRLWQLIEVKTPSEMELRNILATKFPLLRNLIARFIQVFDRVLHIYSMTSFISLNRGSHPRVISTRDLMKFCSRCDRMLQNKGVTSADQLLESSLYENIFAEAVECFGSAITEHTALDHLVKAIGVILEVPTSRVNLFLQSYVPTLHADDSNIEIGRAVLAKSAADKALYVKKKRGNDTNFARTKHSKRLMEQIGVAIEMVEPVLLVGETGTGKTTVVQEIAKMMNKKLTVINVSQQTESGDLLGGFKPVNTKTVAIPLQEVFENLFLATFSQKKNERFSQLLTKCFNKNQWKNVIKLWKEAVKMAGGVLKTEDSDEENDDGAPKKKRKLRSSEKSVLLQKWLEFRDDVSNFEAQASNLENSFVFSFVEGSLVKAVRNGEWLLLDEINLASPDTLESIADLLSESLEQRSILLSERGDVEATRAHHDFRIFGCMNPSTDVGKRDLPLSIRSRFSEIYVHSPDQDREDLLSIIDKYIDRYAVGDEWVADDIAELYTEAKKYAEANKIVDGANQKPHFSIRTLTRTLIYVRDIVSIYGLRRALYEGFCMAFLTLLDVKSEQVLKPVIEKYTIGKLKNARATISRIPPAPSGEDDYVQFKHYWMKRGPNEIESPNYIITPFVEKNLLNLVRATASRKFPVLVQGPTSAGKTSMINYLASITGHKFVRINNHEHTDLQEYLGTYVSDASGKLVFREGVLVEALRKGHWIVLDELNLAPTDVLEALNRLLDDNRELFIPETQEVVHPHPDFMLFATQNPPGLYGGRKVLSRAFRNRFLELHFDDIPQDELEIILRERCKIAPTYGKKIVEVYKQLSVRRQSTRLFEQKNSFATLRDLFRWALRDAVGYEELAANGYMLLAEKVRNDEERATVKDTIEKVMRVKLDMDTYYEKLENKELMQLESSIVWTKAMRRLAVLVETSIKYKEPLLLVGETGCGKTTVCQILAHLVGKHIFTVNAHQNTETGDILGAQRPLRNRFEIRSNLLKSLITFFSAANIDIALEDAKVDDLIKKYHQVKSKLPENHNVDPELLADIDDNIKNSQMLFEWMDGPLVQAMKTGDFFLLDEISLADDSVLERLNSVLEPERSLFLAEKGTDDAFLTAHDGFQFLATMNPGGDYGKKELSPALRNRFTEIWVPSMDDFNDVKQIVGTRLRSRFASVCEPLVEFSEWFGKRLGNGNANSGVISLRDILAWVEFLNSCDDSISPEAALLHGASMVFIDALGTNNTAYLAENEQTLAHHKQECVAKLSELVGTDLAQYLEGSHVSVQLDDAKLAAGVFEIARLPNHQWSDSFNLHAPTTAANAMRVVRALQVPKPILLEGSPGVGKTSLISAIANATGNELIRINLSEQTDLIDLFGSDAPVEGGQTGEFVWRDAPFLRAMKNGEWVLLDEMNLASQSVLEGLNACLDHRGEAYIPELDKSFPRHPQFKVFAAQNPQYQGGGRKGLPKSFVNRFTVVYVDVLKAEDLTMISHQMFPNVPREDCFKMIQFMSALEDTVVHKKAWGHSGGPWEFNLRDTMRWLALYNSKHNLGSESDLSLGDLLNMIVCQRFRTADDRNNAVALFEGIFGVQTSKDAFYSLGPDYVQAGGSVIKRNDLVQYSNATDKVNYVPLQTNFSVLESAIRSVNESIPLILTGPTNSGKTETIRFLANVVGVKLVEFAMNSDVDSMDILGGYEQVDITRSLTEFADSLHTLLNQLVLLNLKEASADNHALSVALGLVQYLEGVSVSLETFGDLLTRFKAFLSLYSNEELAKLHDQAQALSEKLAEVSTVKFQWFDGLLVQAVTRGDWLVLDNANLCNPSVLDRLNSLMETNGSLIINECSAEDGSPRVLQPHPNFRLFLTVDPKYGELSRAMRNRCVEIYLPGLNERATSFDKLCLGIPQPQETQGQTDITALMEGLEVDEASSVSRPMTAFVSSTDSKLRNLVAVHDAIDMNSERVVSSALASILVLSQLGFFGEWVSTAVSVGEFSGNEKEALEEVQKLIEALHESAYINRVDTLYETTEAEPTLSSKFAKSQTIHPLINRYILGYLERVAPCIDTAEATMVIQVAAALLKSKSLLSSVERKALQGKVSDLSFLESSAAKKLGRELKKAPKIDIYGYVKGIDEFIRQVYLASVASSEFLAEPTVFSALSELQRVWFCLYDVCAAQNISKLRVFHSMMTSWLEKLQSVKVVAQFAGSISSLDLGLNLTSGFSMTKIWEKFRQIYPDSEVAWDGYISLLALLNDLDTLSKKLYPDTYGEVSALRTQILSLHDEITRHELKAEELEELFAGLSKAMEKLGELSDAFVIKRNNEFEHEFSALCNFLKARSQFADNSDDIQAELASYTCNSSSRLIRTTSTGLFSPYPRILDSLWTTDGSRSLVGDLFTSGLLSSTLTKSVKLETCPGKFLDQNLADIKVLGRELVNNSEAVLENQQANFRKLVLAWMAEVLSAHGASTNIDDFRAENLTVDDVRELIEQVNEAADENVASVFNDYFLPALYLASSSNNLSELGKSWVLFASGCIQLFVPSSPLDPAIEEHVAYDVLDEQKKFAQDLVDTWRCVRTAVSGDVQLKLEHDLPDFSGTHLEKPRVFRKNESIDEFFDEWDAFMASSISVEPIKRILAATENLADERNAMIVENFQKNSSNFMMRLGSKYYIYADLNEILNGFIKGIKLGLDLLAIDNENQHAQFHLDSLWPVDIGNLLNAEKLESTFSTVRSMCKSMDVGSSTSEMLILYLVRLCFVHKSETRDPALNSVLNQGLQSLYYRWYYRRLRSEEQAVQQSSLYKHKDTDDAEGDFKELFPDYDDVMDLNADVKKSDEFDDVYADIVDLYVSHFLHGTSSSLEQVCSRGAKITAAMESSKNLVSGPNKSAYLSALLLSIQDSVQSFSVSSDTPVDFYHDAHPTEYKRAMEMILGLYSSVAKLLAQWPEHATLQSISRSADEFLSYPSNYPLAKLLHKIESIFNFMSEWEKFASSQVTLKVHYDELTKLIVSWRKLELSSWKCLFEFEKSNLEKGVGKWWFHLFESIIVPYTQYQDDDDIDEPSVVQVLAALNIFMSETTYGEYVCRLNLVKAFKNHVATLNLQDGQIYNALSNFITFYEQFVPKIEDAIDQTRKTLEKDVSEVILLASWKDVNIDALKQSSRKSHNNLYKIVRKYRALLNQPVSPIIHAGVTDDIKVHLEEKTFRVAEPVSKTTQEKLSTLKTCAGVSTWSERPTRLKSIDTIENNMKIYVDKVANASAPSIYDYAKEIIDEMKRLRDETPKVMNDDTKKTVAALKTQKHKLLSETLKELRRIGVKTTAKASVKKVLTTVNLILVNSETFEDSWLHGADPYYFRILDILPRLRSAVASGNDDIPQPDLERGLAAAENLIFSLLTTRKPLAQLSRSAESLKSYALAFDTVASNETGDLSPASVVASIRLNMSQSKDMAMHLGKLLDYALSTLSSIAFLHKTVTTDVFTSAKAKLDQFLSSLPENASLLYTSSDVATIGAFKTMLATLVADLHTWKTHNPKVAFVADIALDWISEWPFTPFVNSSTSLQELKAVEDVEMALRKLSNSILVAVQQVVEVHKTEISDDDDDWLASSQQRLMSAIKSLHHSKIVELVAAVKCQIEQIEQNTDSSLTTSALVAFTMPLLAQYQKLTLTLLEKARTNYIHVSKATHAMTKSLLTLATDGFCSPEPPSEQKQDDNLHDGTGLGDGEGATNNSKDEEEDDDLAEHAQQPNEEKDKDDNDDENDDAVDMEGDMAGDLEEASDQDNDDEEKDGDDEEDLDEEVDDIDDLDPNAVDEKMWDEEAKEDEKEKDSDKMPQNSTNDDDNMEANEDEEESKENDKDNAQDDSKDNENDDDADDEEDVGEQEDDVKNQENEQMDDFVPETETLDLPEDMNLDDEKDESGDEDDEDEFDDKMDMSDDENEKNDKNEKDEQADENEEGDDNDANDEEAEEDEEGENNDDENAEESNTGAEIDEDNENAMSDEETAQGPDDEEEQAQEDQDDAENGEEAAEGVEGAENDDNEDVDMDSATKTEAGEKGDGSDNQVIEEQDDIGASGAASSDLKQEEESKEEAPSEDSARDEMKESLKQLGDSLKEFHRRRQEIKESSQNDKEEEAEETADVKPDEFEHVDGDNTKHDTQALGAADNKDQIQSIDEEMAIDDDDEPEIKEEDNSGDVNDGDDMDVDDKEEVAEQAENDADDFDAKTQGAVVGERKPVKDEENADVLANAEFEDLEAEKELMSIPEDDYNISVADTPAMPLNEARELWRHSEIATQELASGLSEQLRLILEPTLATKLRGDYKTGKRLNMKRIIPYIASDFRKDKIWLRRTKPSKRQYQIMIAVDDSKSMSESKSTELAFHSIALVSKALTQLESGGLSIVRFGEDVKLVHPFDKPFSQESGAGIFQWFDFKQERTDIKSLCTKSLKIFETARATSNSDLWQLQIILSDGVCEDHETVQRLVRRAREEKVMLVFVVIDGISSNESIMEMSQVSYVPDPVTGAMTLKVENYLDTFPFEFYVVVRNISELPEMLSLILRQYFSEVANM